MNATDTDAVNNAFSLVKDNILLTNLVEAMTHLFWIYWLWKYKYDFNVEFQLNIPLLVVCPAFIFYE